MRRIPLLAAFVAAIFACSCSKEAGAPATKAVSPEEGVRLNASVFVPGQITVLFDDDLVSLVESGNPLDVATRASSLAPALQDLGVVGLERVFPEDREFEQRHREFGLHRWYRVTFRDDVPSAAAMERFSLVPGVLASRPVFRKSLDGQAYFNDPMESEQWHYHNKTVEWADINVVPVWERYTTGSSNVIVAVVDGGIDLNHEDLSSAVILPGDEGSRSFMIGGSPNRITADDHGTHVAGTIGAVNNNGVGVAGVAGGNAAAGIPGVRLLSCQTFEDGNDSGSDSEAAIVWAADRGAVIVSNSWGYSFTDSKGNYDEESARATHNYYQQPNSGVYKDVLKDAIDYFNKYAGMKNGQQTGPMAGGLVVFSSGNDGRPYGPPSNYSGCVAVGAINRNGSKSNFSNYGDWVDICAPGVDVLSTVPGNKYGSKNGTSMACPHVSGVAALVVSYCGGPGFTREKLLEKLLEGANSADVPSASRIGPLVDALGAITFGTGEPPQKIDSFTVDDVVSNNVIVSFKVPADHDGQPAYGARLLASESLSQLQNCNPLNPGVNVIYGDILCRDAGVGDTVTGTVGDLGFEKTYYIAFSAFDYGRNFSPLSEHAVVKTGTNHAPTISTSYTGDFRFHGHDRFVIPFTITDPDLHVLNVQFDKDPTDYGVLTLLESTEPGIYNLQVFGVASPEGKYRGTLKASDNYGLSAEFVINYEVLPNQPPVLKKQVDNVIIHNSGDVVKLDLGDFISDPDGEVLKYSFEVSDKSVVHISQDSESSVIKLTAITDSGLATVKLTASDARGESVTSIFKVLVRSSEHEFQAYPNPVVNVLHVGTGETVENARISIYNSVGAKVFGASFMCSAFEPAEIDMKNAGAGLYTLEVQFGGKVYKSLIIKK